MTNKEFLAFVKRPRHIDDTDGIIMYEDEEEDRAHKRSYKKVTSVILPILISYFIVGCYLCESLQQFLNYFTVYFGGGMCLVWTFMEYVFHRFVLHRELEIDPESEADPEYNA